MRGSEANAGRDADAIVVGAGPAGSVTALLLARRGLDVLLLDRAEFPRSKPCGDCLSAAATTLLARLGLLDRVLHAGAARIHGWDIIAPDGTIASGRFPDTSALALERRVLDALLLDAASHAGARFRQAHVTDLVRRNGRVTGVRVRGHSPTDAPTPAGPTPTGPTPLFELTAPLVVGADGLRSVVARRLDAVRRPPRLRKVSLTAHLPAGTAPAHRGEMHLIPGGCVGFAPAGASANLTVVSDDRLSDDLRELGPVPFFRDRVALAHGLDRRLDGALDALSPDDLLASGPFDVPVRSPVAPGIALVGDAAGYYDPFTGQGVFHAMASAEQLADAVAPVLSSNARGLDRAMDGALDAYARRKRRLTRTTRRVQRGVEWVLSRPRLANVTLGRLARAQAAMDRLVAVTGDLEPAASLLSPSVVSSFMFPRSGGST